MRPLNYAILKYFTKVEEGSVADIMASLEKEYSSYKAFSKNSISQALMTAEANGLIEEKSFKLDENGDLLIFYRANEESKKTINDFIKD